MRLSFKDWKNFVDKGIQPTSHLNHVNHWMRSKDHGVNPKLPTLQPGSFRPTPPSDVTKELIYKAKTIIAPDLNITQNLRLAWVLCDTSGTVHEILSENEDILDHFSLIDLEVGSNLSIESTGTHAISMAMTQKNVTLCHKYENYSCYFHPYITVATPIYNMEGEVMGYIGIFCYATDGEAANLQISLRLVIQALDAKMRIQRLADRFHSLQDKQEQLIEQDRLPTVNLSTEGEIKQINPAALSLLNKGGIALDDILTKPLRTKPSLESIALSAMEQNNVPIEISLKNKVLHGTYTSSPILNRADQFIGVTLTLNTIEGASFTASPKKKQKSQIKPQQTRLNTFEDIIGNSRTIAQARDLARQIAQSPVSVLLTGESGTGKEMFAQSIHNGSDFSAGPFISLNCSAIPRDIAESEFFGYAKGAFTGALKDGRIGKLEAANNGTIFLDEIGEMPLELQAKILRVLETRTLSRVGENTERPINLRVISATNRDLREQIDKKEFREDLFYRIAVSTIKLPALRKCPSDIPALFRNFIKIYNKQMGKMVRDPAHDLLKLLTDYPWKGNIRELRNTAEYCVMMNRGDEPVQIKHLPGEMRVTLLYPEAEEIQDTADPVFKERQTVQESEAALIKKAIDMSNGNVPEAAKTLGMSRATLYRRIKKLREEGRLS